MERSLEKKSLVIDPDTWLMQLKMMRMEGGEMRPRCVKILKRGIIDSTQKKVHAKDESNDQGRIEVPGLNEEVKEVKLPNFKTWEEREADLVEVDLRNQKFLRKK